MSRSECTLLALALEGLKTEDPLFVIDAKDDPIIPDR